MIQAWGRRKRNLLGLFVDSLRVRHRRDLSAKLLKGDKRLLRISTTAGN